MVCSWKLLFGHTFFVSPSGPRTFHATFFLAFCIGQLMAHSKSAQCSQERHRNRRGVDALELLRHLEVGAATMVLAVKRSAVVAVARRITLTGWNVLMKIAGRRGEVEACQTEGTTQNQGPNKPKKAQTVYCFVCGIGAQHFLWSTAVQRPRISLN